MKFTKVNAARICTSLAKGNSLRSTCAVLKVPESTVRTWVLQDIDFAAAFARAREIGCHSLADECLEISDRKRGDVQRDRLRIDTRMRLLGKWMPRVYGDKLAISGDGDTPLTVTVQRLSTKAK